MTVLLNYCDIDIYQRDILLLEDGRWLNDSILSFCLRRSMTIPNHDDSVDMIVVDAPIVSYLRIQCEEDGEFEVSNWLLFPDLVD
jgi:hypothetical protein